jgi:hypothetical protein
VPILFTPSTRKLLFLEWINCITGNYILFYFGNAPRVNFLQQNFFERLAYFGIFFLLFL